MTQIEAAKSGQTTPQAHAVALKEGQAEAQLKRALARGHAVIPFNPAHSPSRPAGIGSGLSIKVNANVGTSPSVADIDLEVQ